MNSTIEQAVEQVEVPAIHAQITGILNGLQAVQKIKGLTDAAREQAAGPLQAALKASIEELGQPVARGNTLWVAHAGELLIIDMTPKGVGRGTGLQLVRL